MSEKTVVRSRKLSWTRPGFLAVALALASLATASASEPEALNVQARWRVVGVAAATSASPGPASREVSRALKKAGDCVARELPGIHWEISAKVRAARYEDAATGKLELGDDRFRALVEGLAEKDDELAQADVVFVYVVAPEQDYAGMSVLRAHPRSKAPVWYSVVNTHQGPRMARGALARLEKDANLHLDASQHETAERALRLVASPLDRGPLQEFAVWASTVHEFGHLLCPGTQDVRAAKDLTGFIGNGAEEPAKHGNDKRCVMFTPDPESLMAKALGFPRLVRFCDGCRRRLGLPPRD